MIRLGKGVGFGNDNLCCFGPGLYRPRLDFGDSN